MGDKNSSDTDDDDAVAGDQHPSDAATTPAASGVTGTCEVCVMQPRYEVQCRCGSIWTRTLLLALCDGDGRTPAAAAASCHGTPVT